MQNLSTVFMLAFIPLLDRKFRLTFAPVVRG